MEINNHGNLIENIILISGINSNRSCKLVVVRRVKAGYKEMSTGVPALVNDTKKESYIVINVLKLCN